MVDGWEDIYNEILQPKHSAALDVITNGSYVKVGKGGLLLNSWRQRFKVYNQLQPRVHSIDFMQKMQEKVAEAQRYCDVAYVATTIIKQIPQ